MWGIIIAILMQGSGLKVNFDNWGEASNVVYYVISNGDTGRMTQIFEKVEDGYSFTKFVRQTPSNTVIEDSAVLIIDEKGVPKWFYEKTSMKFGKNNPLTSLTVAEYKDTLIEILRGSPNGSFDTVYVKIDGIAYPSGLVPFLLEGVKLKKGDSLNFKVFFPANGLVDEGSAFCEDEEELQTPLGDKRALRLKLKMGRRNFHVWFDREKPHRMLRYKDDKVNIEFLIKEVAK